MNDTLRESHLWFFGKYLIVEPNSAFCNALHKHNLDQTFLRQASFAAPLPEISKYTRVFNIDAHALVPVRVVDDGGEDFSSARARACPQLQISVLPIPNRPDIPAGWNQTLLRHNGESGLDIFRAGQPETRFCDQCAPGRSIVSFIGPERILIAGGKSDWDGNARIFDTHGTEISNLQIKEFRPAYLVFDQSGTHFAVTWAWQSGLGHVLYYFDDLVSGAGIVTDRKKLQIFSTSIGQKLFDKTWRSVDESATVFGAEARMAFSGDGKLFAYINSSHEVIIMKVPEETRK